MADNTTVKDTTESIALSPSKGPLKLFLDFFGGKTLRLNNDLGAMAIFFFRSFFMIFRLKAIPDIIAQVYFIGAKSVQIVVLVAFFTGMVLGLQLYFVLVKFGSVGVLGTAIALTLIREMGPVLSAIMITARAGSAMTAEIGIQRISEQIDALATMRIDPLGYLISPRIAAAIISFPILTTLFDLVGIIGAHLAEQFETVRSIKLRVGALPQHPTGQPRHHQRSADDRQRFHERAGQRLQSCELELLAKHRLVDHRQAMPFGCLGRV